MKGKVSQWNDEKGFGFIQPDDNFERVFFHISVVYPTGMRPKVGVEIQFEVEIDKQQRVRATQVIVEGAPLSMARTPKRQPPAHRPARRQGRIELAPVKRTPLDYLCLSAGLLLGLVAVFLYVNTHNLAQTLMAAVPAALLLMLGNRAKTPDSEFFTCCRCHTDTRFNRRTIAAWNRGSLKLYCGSCHARWLDERNSAEGRGYATGNGGCLGLCVMAVVLPTSLWALYVYLV
ncbi:cold shock domain-containing protein [Pseudaeromonas sp. ZJS20]|uniref:cold-shock protein n=1 Tax=Pseudaeromonas aegiceratis TaxID=3153928 RepID=UPI00390C7F0A